MINFWDLTWSDIYWIKICFSKKHNNISREILWKRSWFWWSWRYFSLVKVAILKSFNLFFLADKIFNKAGCQHIIAVNLHKQKIVHDFPNMIHWKIPEWLKNLGGKIIAKSYNSSCIFNIFVILYMTKMNISYLSHPKFPLQWQRVKRSLLLVVLAAV